MFALEQEITQMCRTGGSLGLNDRPYYSSSYHKTLQTDEDLGTASSHVAQQNCTDKPAHLPWEKPSFFSLLRQPFGHLFHSGHKPGKKNGGGEVKVTKITDNAIKKYIDIKK